MRRQLADVSSVSTRGISSRLPTWGVTLTAAVGSAVAYFLVMRAGEEMLGGVKNWLAVPLTASAVFAPVVAVIYLQRIRRQSWWAKPLILGAVLISGFLIWYLVVG